MKAKALEQTEIPGTETPRKRQTKIEKAIAGDLVIAYDRNAEDGPSAVVAIELVTIIERWKDQGICDRTGPHEARPGDYFR